MQTRTRSNEQGPVFAEVAGNVAIWELLVSGLYLPSCECSPVRPLAYRGGRPVRLGDNLSRHDEVNRPVCPSSPVRGAGRRRAVCPAGGSAGFYKFGSPKFAAAHRSVSGRSRPRSASYRPYMQGLHLRNDVALLSERSCDYQRNLAHCGIPFTAATRHAACSPLAVRVSRFAQTRTPRMPSSRTKVCAWARPESTAREC